MSKIWSCSGFCVVYLTPAPRLFVGVEDCFWVALVNDLLALLLLVILFWFNGEIEQMEQHWLFPLFKLFLVFLVTYPFSLSMDEQMTRVWALKRLYMLLLYSPWSTAWLWSLWWLTDAVWVLCHMHKQCLGVEHAHLMCVLLVCLCEPDPVNLALERISSADLILSSISILFLTCQVALPLGIICSSLWFCAGIIHWAKWTKTSSNTRSNEDDLVEFRLGLLTCNFSLFSFLLFCPFV